MLELKPRQPHYPRMAKRIPRLIAELKEWAASRGLRQKDLAKLLGVSPQLVTEWFAKRREPTGEKVLEIQELLKTNPPLI
jgi:transcriptional regulator with XRE-family HTH domain